MTLTVRLLGKPSLEVDGRPRQLAGRKTWGLLALLVLRSAPPTRTELVEILWPEADDPAAALRWTLARVRKALAPEIEIRGDAANRLTLSIQSPSVIDAQVVTGGAYTPDDVERLQTGALLEGFAFDDAPLFEARFDAGDYEAAIDAARRASADAAASGLGRLEAEASALLATILIHSVRGRDQEALGLLARALLLAHEAGDAGMASEIERESGYVAFLAGDYGGAEAALARARSLADAAANDDLAGRALTILGASRSDRGDHLGALTALHEGLRRLAAAGNGRWRAYAGTYLGRLLIEFGEVDEARLVAAGAVTEARTSGWISLVPFPLTIEADAALASGDAGMAAALNGEAYTLAAEMGDPCWEALSLLGLARCKRASGEPDEARRLLVAAKDRCSRYPDTYQWAVAQVLVELAEVEHGVDRDHVAEARRLAQRGPMASVVARLDRLAAHRVLATVLFTDIVGSTAMVADMGDLRWQRVLEQHHALVRRQLAAYSGREVDTAGDGFFATFESPAQAIRCAAAIASGARSLGMEVRAGLHVGECEIIDGKVGGIAVHIGARVAGSAGPGEILVSGTVKDLVAGSGMAFRERGVAELRGIPGTWALFAVDPASL